MNELYPPESQKLDVIEHLEELRRRICICLISMLIFAVVLWSQGQLLLRIVKHPLHTLAADLIFITPTEVFVSYLKVVLLFSLACCFPVLVYEAWAFLAPAASRSFRSRSLLWLVLLFFFFLLGVLFSYRIALPGALRFLFAFGQGIARPQISLAKYVSFFCAFMLIGGMIFEIPIVMGLLTDMGVLQTAVIRAYRKYALFAILVLAAVITPTQDIFNMMVFAVPMMLLFEVGMVMSVVIERCKK